MAVGLVHHVRREFDDVAGDAEDARQTEDGGCLLGDEGQGRRAAGEVDGPADVGQDVAQQLGQDMEGLVDALGDDGLDGVD